MKAELAGNSFCDFATVVILSIQLQWKRKKETPIRIWVLPIFRDTRFAFREPEKRQYHAMSIKFDIRNHGF